jgi:hypothetical protein
VLHPRNCGQDFAGDGIILGQVASIQQTAWSSHRS